MIEFEQALSAILKNAEELDTENVPVDDCAGRILAEDVYSKIEMPPFNKSAMDGYAVKAAELSSVPLRLKSAGFIQAGRIFEGKLKSGECVKIMTGACLPDGADSVVMVEDTEESGDCVEIRRAVKKWENVCFRGEDIKKGKKVLEKGRVISLSDIALLATVGRVFLKVIRKPQVAVLNTGGEILPVGSKLGKGKIYNSNGPQLLSLLRADGISTHYLGIAKDRRGELKKAIQRGLRIDVLLISGGVSMGDYDLVPEVLKDSGVREIFHKVKIKPGKPLFFGRQKDTIIFGIPGNPVSNFLTYNVFIRPALQKMMGRKEHQPVVDIGIIEKCFRHRPGRKHFVLVKISKKGGRSYLLPVESHGSADIVALSEADGFMILEADVSLIEAGEQVQFITWKREQNLM